MDIEGTTKVTPPKAKRKTKVTPKKATVVPPPVTTKVVHNVSLQAWPIPTGTGTINLAPGSSVTIPASAMTERVINLMKRRLISIH